jgi:hypothetical protein
LEKIWWITPVLFIFSQILISKKFEKEIVYESSVLAWIQNRIRNWIRIQIEQKCWIRICIKSIRIHNPGQQCHWHCPAIVRDVFDTALWWSAVSLTPLTNGVAQLELIDEINRETKISWNSPFKQTFTKARIPFLLFLPIKMVCLISEGGVEDAEFLGISAVLKTRSATLMKYLNQGVLRFLSVLWI